MGKYVIRFIKNTLLFIEKIDRHPFLNGVNYVYLSAGLVSFLKVLTIINSLKIFEIKPGTTSYGW